MATRHATTAKKRSDSALLEDTLIQYVLLAISTKECSHTIILSIIKQFMQLF